MIEPVRETRQTIAEYMLGLNDIDIGRLASGGYGKEKQTRFLDDLREIAKTSRRIEVAGLSRG